MKKYEVRNEFEHYLCGNNKNCSYGQYTSKVAIIIVNTSIYYPDAIAYSFQVGNISLAEELLQELYDQIPKNKSSKSYFRAFDSFVRNTTITTNFTSRVVNWYKTNVVSTALSSSTPIDGMKCLISALGGDLQFIKLAIENSFFFQFDNVQKRHCKIVQYINNHQSHEFKNDARKDEYVNSTEATQMGVGLPARRTNVSLGGTQGSHQLVSNQLSYIDEYGKFICHIVEDGNGNAKVCNIIRYYTGVYLNVKTAKKPLKNYIISHIWGRAIDPRYFTNLWNIVLVPAWANHLLDKDADNSPLARLYKYVMQRICVEIYINKIKCNCTELSCETNDITWKPWYNEELGRDEKPIADKSLLEKLNLRYLKSENLEIGNRQLTFYQ